MLRLDGRGFSRFTEQRFAKPFNPRFADHMIATAQTLLAELSACYADIASDEISLLLDPGFDLFGRSVEKLDSVSAGIASAAVTQAGGEPAHVDSRLWLGTTIADLTDYFSWRQADAARCALNGWCYRTLRNAGQSRQQATRALDGASTADKNELLFRHGGSTSTTYPLAARGVGLW